MSPRQARVPGRAVARFSQWVEALGCLALLVWTVLSFVDGHTVLGLILSVVTAGMLYVTVREFRGHGLGKAPTGSPEDTRH